MSKSQFSDYSDRMWELLFSVRRSFHYHEHRERFFTLLHNMVNLTWIICGTLAVWKLMESDTQIYLVAVPTIASVIDIIIGFASKISVHKVLKQRYLQLETEIVSDPDNQKYVDFHRKRRVIESDEPPKLHALDVLCHNEVVRASYPPEDAREHLAKVPWLPRCSAQLLSWPKTMSSI